MRARRVSLLILAALIASAAVAGAFVLNGPKWGTQQVQYYINPSNGDMSEADAIAAIQAGASAWSAQSRANILPYYMGRTSATSISRNGVNEVFFRNTSAGGLYGDTYWWYDSGNRLIEADIMFYDSGMTFFKGSSGCSYGVYLQDAMTHEFGHALGLGHSPLASATMYPTMLWCSLDPRSLDGDDLAGIETLYPSAGANTAPTVSIAAPIAGSTAVQGTQVAFTASASDKEDGNISGRILWMSTIDGHFGTGGSISRALSVGSHGITAAVTDNAGVTTTSQTTLVVTSTSLPAPPPPPTSSMSLAASGYKVRGWQQVALTWSGAATSSVYLYRDGVRILTTANDGAETDALNRKGAATYTYVLCEVGTSACSSPVTVRF